jgi:thiol-disulfide isomerase/thioredoxin
MKRVWVTTLMVTFVFARGASAQSTNEKIKIGLPAPVFKDLPGVDGKSHSMADFLKDSKCTVIAITCNHCPIAKAYEDRLVQFAKDYESKGVKVVAINVNNGDEDKLPAMKQRAKEKAFTFAYLYDASQKIGRDLGAAVTPEFFVLDSKGIVVFTGAMDDSMTPTKVTKKYVQDAVDAVLAGKPVAVSKVPRSGCSVEYDN